jgi:hypothetical protein
MIDTKQKLIDWYKRLLNSSFSSIESNFAIFMNYFNDNHLCQSILIEAENTLSEDVKENLKCKKTNDLWEFQSITKDSREKVLYAHNYILKNIYQNIKDKPNRSIIGFIQSLGCGNFDSQLREFVEEYVKPLLDYLTDKIEDANNMLYLLEKYKKDKEWFYRKQFFEQYVSENRSEEFLDMDLRKFLFDNGIEFPFSKHNTPSGIPDVVANLGQKNNLVLEIKLIDTEKGYGVKRITEGFGQIVKYANDCNTPIGYLLVFNADNRDKEIVIEGEPKSFPAKIHFNKRTFFIIIANINPEGKSAGKIKYLEYFTISKDDLFKEAERKLVA